MAEDKKNKYGMSLMVLQTINYLESTRGISQTPVLCPLSAGKIKLTWIYWILDENATFLTVVKPYLTLFFGELVGTMVLMFVGCGTGINFVNDPLVSHYVKAAGFSLAVLLAIQMVGHITACHINPAVTIVGLLVGCITAVQFVVYVMAQFLGSFLGFYLLKVLSPDRYTPSGFCMTRVANEVTLTQAFLIELIITFILCLVVCAVWDPRNAKYGDSVPLRFALIVSVLSMMASPLTGASMNTARTFGPAVFGTDSDWNDQWIYWVAPNISPFIAVGFYKLFFAAPNEKVNQKTESIERTP